MGIGSVTSTNGMSVMQMTTTNTTDTKSKSIQKELTDVQQRMQKLSSDSELSVNEKSNERKQLQKEKSNLNTELKQHQEELLRSQKRESMLAELREAQGAQKKTAPDSKTTVKEESSDSKLQTNETITDQAAQKNPETNESQSEQTRQPGTIITQSSDGTVILKEVLAQKENTGADTAKESSDESEEGEKAITLEEEAEPAKNNAVTDTGLSDREVHAMVSANISAQQANRLGAVVTKTNDGIAILKSEIEQDERRGVDPERKQAELEKMERQEARAAAFQFSVLGGANNAMKAAMETNVDGTESGADNVENNAYAKALNVSREEQAQQRFYVSFG